MCDCCDIAYFKFPYYLAPLLFVRNISFEYHQLTLQDMGYESPKKIPL